MRLIELSPPRFLLRSVLISILFPLVGVLLLGWEVRNLIAYYYAELVIVTIISYAMRLLGRFSFSGVANFIQDLVIIFILLAISRYIVNFAESVHGLPQDEAPLGILTIAIAHAAYLLPLELFFLWFWRKKNYKQKFEPRFQTRALLGYFYVFIGIGAIVVFLSLKTRLPELVPLGFVIGGRHLMDWSRYFVLADDEETNNTLLP